MHRRHILACVFLTVACVPLLSQAREQGGSSASGNAIHSAERTPAQAKGSTVPGGAVLMDSAAGASREQLEAQYETLRQIDDLRVTYDARGLPRTLYGRTSLAIPTDIHGSAGRAALEQALALVRTILLAEETETLTLAREPDARENDVLRSIQFKQSIRGIPVRDAHLTLTVDNRTGKVAMISAAFLPDRDLPSEPRVTASEAVAAAFDWLQKSIDLGTRRPAVRESSTGFVAPPPLEPGSLDGVKVHGAPVLSYRIGQVETHAEPARLVWVVELERESARFNTIEVDAISGDVVGESPPNTLTRKVYNSNGGTSLGTLVRSEGQPPSSDPPINSVYDHLGWALSALDVIAPTGVGENTFRLAVRNVTNGAYNAIAGQVYDGPSANWIYDIKFGPGVQGNPLLPSTHLGNALDIVAHELSHEVAFEKFSLQCSGSECGYTATALNEGLADVAAIAVDMNYSRPNPWNVGEDAYANGVGARSAATPQLVDPLSRDWWPDASHATASEGGAHDNATILSHAYFLSVNGGYHNRAGMQGIPQLLVPALGRQTSERIFYKALTDGGLGPTATFLTAKNVTKNIALAQFGQPASDAVSLAWDAVGVTQCSTPPAAPSLQTELICPWWKLKLYPVTGATTYHSQYSIYPSYSPAASWHDGSDTSDCEVYPYIWTYFRARACNACGCSAWSPNAIAYPWQGECP